MEDQLKSPRFLKYKSKRIAQMMSPPLHLFLLSLGFKNKEAESAVFFLVSYFRLSYFPLLTTFTFHLFCFLFNFMTTLFCSHRTKRNSGIIKIETPPRQSNFPLPDLVYYPFRVSWDIATSLILHEAIQSKPRCFLFFGPKRFPQIIRSSIIGRN